MSAYIEAVDVKPLRGHFGLYVALMLATCVASAGITVIYNVLPTLQLCGADRPHRNRDLRASAEARWAARSPNNSYHSLVGR